MKVLHPTAYNFMVYKDYKIDVKFLFPMSIINNRIYDLSNSYINKHPVPLNCIGKGTVCIFYLFSFNLYW